MGSYLESGNKFECSGCQSCKNICPKNSISMKYDNEGFLYPIIDENKCIKCKMCINVCEYNNGIKEVNDQKVYAAINKNEDIIKKSTSGGLFISLSEYVLNQGGYVCGAKFTDDFLVEHEITNNKEVRDSFCGSKYLQSDIGDTYKNVKKYLEQEKIVLFTGTPCQVDGLKNYLNKDYSNLILVDLVCHGVPSPMVFKGYINQKKKKYKSNISNLSFRYNTEGKGNKNLKIDFHNGKLYMKNENKNTYYYLFNKSAILRPSCFKCRYSNTNRVSDITIGDFWGIESVKPDFPRENGVSLVIVNTTKGEKIFNVIKESLIIEESNLEEAKKRQSNLNNAVKDITIRRKYFNIYKKLGIKAANFTIGTFSLIIRNKINILRKIKHRLLN